MVTSKVLDVIKEATGVGNVTPKMRLVADLGVEDSLDMYDVMVALEEAFKISIPEEEIARKFRIEQDVYVFEIIEFVNKSIRQKKDTILKPIAGLYSLAPSKDKAVCCLTEKSCDKITPQMLGTKANWCRRTNCRLAENFYRLVSQKIK